MKTRRLHLSESTFTATLDFCLQKSQLFILQIWQLRKKHQDADSLRIVSCLTLFSPHSHPVDNWSQQQLEENVKDLDQE